MPMKICEQSTNIKYFNLMIKVITYLHQGHPTGESEAKTEAKTIALSTLPN